MMNSYFYRNPYGFYPSNRFRTIPNDLHNYVPEYKTIKTETVEENVKSDENNESDTRHLQGSSKPVFEIFGIKLFFDDLLILSLLFFLYSEGVKDQSLFISLVLLLLS